MSEIRSEAKQIHDAKLSKHRHNLETLDGIKDQTALEAEFTVLKAAITQDIADSPNEKKLLEALLHEVESAEAERSHSNPKLEIKEAKDLPLALDVKETKTSAAQTPQPSILEIKERLLKAIQSNELETVKRLVESGFDINTPFKHGETALHIAANNQTPEIFEYLLSQNPNLVLEPMFRTFSETIALFSPWKRSEKEKILDLLKSKGAPPLDPLLIHAALGDLDKIQESKTDEILAKRDSYNLSPLHYAAANGQTKTLEWLLDQGVNIHEWDTIPIFPIVIRNGQLETVKCLLKKHPELLRKLDIARNNLLYEAVSEGQIEILEFLISQLLPKEKSTYIHQKNIVNWTPLLKAASTGKLEAMKCLIKHGANIDDKDADGETALLLAAFRGHLAVVEWILKTYPSKIHEKNKDGFSVLMMAAMSGHFEIAQHLSEISPTKIHEKDANGKTPLHWAAQGNHLDILQDLVSKAEKDPSFSMWEQSDAKLTENEGRTPLHWAAQEGALEVVKWLVTKYPQDIDQIDHVSIRMTPLQRALWKGRIENIETIRYLISNGASLHYKNNFRGQNALEMAARARSADELLPILISEFGADPNEISSQFPEKERFKYLNLYQNYFVKQKIEMLKIILKNALENETLLISPLINIIFEYLDITEVSQLDLEEAFSEFLPKKHQNIIFEYLHMNLSAEEENLPQEIKAATEKLLTPLKAHIEACTQKPYKHKALSRQLMHEISIQYPCNPLTVRRAIIALLKNHEDTIKGSEFSGILNNMLEKTSYLKESTEKQIPEAKKLPLEDIDQQRNALLIAIKAHDAAKTKALLAAYPELYKPDASGNTLLSYVAAIGQMEILAFLLSHLPKAEIHKKNKDGNTPFLLAAANGQVEAMFLLLENGANINDTNNTGMTAFSLVAQNDAPDAVQWLFSPEKVGIPIEKLIKPLKNLANSLWPYKHQKLSKQLDKEIFDQKPQNILSIHRTVDAFLHKHRSTIKGSDLEKILDQMIQQTSKFCEPETVLLASLADAMRMFKSESKTSPQATSQTTMTVQPSVEGDDEETTLEGHATLN